MISVRIKQFLDRYRVTYRVLNHPRAQTLQDVIQHLRLAPENILTTYLIQGTLGRILLVDNIRSRIRFKPSRVYIRR